MSNYNKFIFKIEKEEDIELINSIINKYCSEKNTTEESFKQLIIGEMIIDVYYTVEKDSSKTKYVSFSVNQIRFSTESFYNLIKEIGSAISMSGTGYNEYEPEKDPEVLEEGKKGIFKRSYDVEDFWPWSLFSKELVEKYGKDKLFSAPVEFVEEFNNGSVFLMINKNSMGTNNFEQRKKLREYLRNE